MTKNHEPLVSVIVPVYKVEKYLRTCLDSILNQSYRNWEAILVDDGSPDNCPAIIDEYASREPRMRTVHRVNGGQSAARNSGLRTVQGDFVTFLDSDDFWHRDYLKDLVGIATACNVDIAQCDFTRGQETSFPQIDVVPKVNIYDNHSIFTSFAAKVIVWGKVYRQEILQDIEFPEGRVNEDDCTNWRFYYRAKTIAVTNRKLYYYTINPNSTMGKLHKRPDLRFIDAYRERIEFFEKESQPDLVAVSRIQLLKSLSLLVGSKNVLPEDFAVINSERKHQLQKLKASGFKTPTTLMAIFNIVDLSPRMFGRVLSKVYSRKNQ